LVNHSSLSINDFLNSDDMAKMVINFFNSYNEDILVQMIEIASKLHFKIPSNYIPFFVSCYTNYDPNFKLQSLLSSFLLHYFHSAGSDEIFLFVKSYFILILIHLFPQYESPSLLSILSSKSKTVCDILVQMNFTTTVVHFLTLNSDNLSNVLNIIGNINESVQDKGFLSP
jgi:hypothetical protein